MSLAYPTMPGDIDHVIADDHAVVERQFQHLEAGRGDRGVLVLQISFELSLHAFAEETVLYPQWAAVGMGDVSERARREHHALKELLVRVGRGAPGADDFEAALAELIAKTRAHVIDEEQVELPAFRDQVGATRMAELGADFIAAKRKAPPAPHPHAPDHGLAERAAAVVEAPLDALKAKAAGKTKRLATDASGLLDPQAQAIVDAHASLQPKPFEILSPAQARRQPGPDAAVKKLLQDRGESTAPEAVGSVAELQIPDGAGGRQTLRVYKPVDGAEPLPVIMWIHGGGWVLFDLDTYDASCRGLANKAGAIVVSPDYRRAPEAVFPASHEDVLAAYRWTVENAAVFGGDPARIGIGGESVGGNMAAATILALLNDGEPLPAAQVCVYPLTTGEQYGPSMEDAADGRPLNRALLSWMAMHAFAGVPEAAQDPRIDLLGWPRTTLAKMPSTLVITDERDVLRSQGQRFAELLQEAGADATLLHYDGVMHEFFGAAAVLDKARDAQLRAAEHFTRAFASAVRARVRPAPIGEHPAP